MRRPSSTAPTAALATFYGEILGMRINEDTDGAWVVIGREPGMRELAFQKADPYVPPRWPDAGHPQQEHLDIRVTTSTPRRAVVALCHRAAERDDGSGLADRPAPSARLRVSRQSGRTTRSWHV